jgi:hypothetical protein
MDLDIEVIQNAMRWRGIVLEVDGWRVSASRGRWVELGEQGANFGDARRWNSAHCPPRNILTKGSPARRGLARGSAGLGDRALGRSRGGYGKPVRHCGPPVFRTTRYQAYLKT